MFNGNYIGQISYFLRYFTQRLKRNREEEFYEIPTNGTQIKPLTSF